MKTWNYRYLRSERSAISRRKFKLQCVEYKGGSCEKCGYNTCIDALSFHHEDPAHKDFQISQARRSFDECRSELDKCLLLCNNCHAEAHYWMRASAKMDMLDLMNVEIY